MIKFIPQEIKYVYDGLDKHPLDYYSEKFEYVVFNDKYIIGKKYGNTVELSYRNEKELYYFTNMTLKEISDLLKPNKILLIEGE